MKKIEQLKEYEKTIFERYKWNINKFDKTKEEKQKTLDCYVNEVHAMIKSLNDVYKCFDFCSQKQIIEFENELYELINKLQQTKKTF